MIKRKRWAKVGYRDNYEPDPLPDTLTTFYTPCGCVCFEFNSRLAEIYNSARQRDIDAAVRWVSKATC